MIEVANFSAIFYGPWFLKSAIPQSFLRNDVKIIRQIKVYQETNLDVAFAVLKAMQGQAWYLTPPFIAMSLVDEDLPDKTRQGIASRLLGIPKPDAFTVGRLDIS